MANIPLNHTAVKLSVELADELTQPVLEYFEAAPDDEAARAFIRLLHKVADENSADLRAMFVNDVALRIYGRTLACRDAALSFASN